MNAQRLIVLTLGSSLTSSTSFPPVSTSLPVSLSFSVPVGVPLSGSSVFPQPVNANDINIKLARSKAKIRFMLYPPLNFCIN